jgi:hypothetical protein
MQPSMRDDWAAAWAGHIKPGGQLVTLIFPVKADKPRDEGPPFPVTPELYTQLLTPHGGFSSHLTCASIAWWFLQVDRGTEEPPCKGAYTASWMHARQPACLSGAEQASSGPTSRQCRQRTATLAAEAWSSWPSGKRSDAAAIADAFLVHCHSYTFFPWHVVTFHTAHVDRAAEVSAAELIARCPILPCL